ncbi:MAG: DUF6702 family protein [Verrucomicrobiota bacterium]
MNRRSPTVLLAAASLFHVAFVFCAQAHEQKTALTDLLFNERTGNLEIAHRISIHDAEHVLRRLGQKSEDLIHSEEAQSRFAEYVTNEFLLKRKDGTTFDLLLVGQEIEGGHLWVYQEIAIAELDEGSFAIHNSILHDEVKDQVNTVNVRSHSDVTTFIFTAGSEDKTYKHL